MCRRFTLSITLILSFWIRVALASESCAYLDAEAFEPGAGDGWPTITDATRSTLGSGTKLKTVFQFISGATVGAHSNRFTVPKYAQHTVTPTIHFSVNSTDVSKQVCWEVCVVATPRSTTHKWEDNDGDVAACTVAEQPISVQANASNTIPVVLNSMAIRMPDNAACAGATACRSAKTVVTVKRKQCSANDYGGTASLHNLQLCWTNMVQ